jgi:hypothetical protein
MNVGQLRELLKGMHSDTEVYLTLADTRLVIRARSAQVENVKYLRDDVAGICRLGEQGNKAVIIGAGN